MKIVNGSKTIIILKSGVNRKTENQQKLLHKMRPKQSPNVTFPL